MRRLSNNLAMLVTPVLPVVVAIVVVLLVQGAP